MAEPMIQVVVPADDLNLLTIEEWRVAVGLAPDDDSQDESVEALGLRVSAMIASACRVAKDGVNPPTLLLESLNESIRVTDCITKTIKLARKPVAAVISVTERDVTLTPDTDFEFDGAEGTVTRLCSGDVSTWAEGKLVIEYDAGFDPVPDDLKALAAQLAGGYWADAGVDPQQKRLEIPGVIVSERWVDTGADLQMPADILNSLVAGGYVTRDMVF